RTWIRAPCGVRPPANERDEGMKRKRGPNEAVMPGGGASGMPRPSSVQVQALAVRCVLKLLEPPLGAGQPLLGRVEVVERVGELALPLLVLALVRLPGRLALQVLDPGAQCRD